MTPGTKKSRSVLLGLFTPALIYVSGDVSDDVSDDVSAAMFQELLLFFKRFQISQMVKWVCSVIHHRRIFRLHRHTVIVPTTKHETRLGDCLTKGHRGGVPLTQNLDLSERVRNATELNLFRTSVYADFWSFGGISPDSRCSLLRVSSGSDPKHTVRSNGGRLSRLHSEGNETNTSSTWGQTSAHIRLGI